MTALYDELGRVSAPKLTAWQIDMLSRFGSRIAPEPETLEAPDLNSYQITLYLADVTKRDALALAEAIRVLRAHELPDVSLSEVTVAHVKAVAEG